MAVRLKDRVEANVRQSDKVNNSLSIQLNSGTATVYDGSTARSINITPDAIGAATTTHTHTSFADGLKINGHLKLGASTTGDNNYIAFYGIAGDQPGSYNHAYIGENLYFSDECSELVLFKGNDIGNDAVNPVNPGPDRIRHIAGAHLFQVYNSALSGTFAEICDSAVPQNVMSININNVTIYKDLNVSGNINGHITGYARGITDNTFGNVLVITKNQGALITAYRDGVVNWALERRGESQEMSAHFYNTSTGVWVKEHILLDNNNYPSYAIPKAGGQLTGALTFANNTWNPVGDDAAFGDHNYAGAICFKALNHNETSVVLYNPAETAAGVIRLDSNNNLILYADGGIVYSSAKVGISGTKSIYFDTSAASRGIEWHQYQSGKTAPHLLRFISGANDGANAANGYWGDIQMHANSDTGTNMYVTRWQDGVEQGRICLLDQWNNTWKSSGSLYLQNSGSLVCEWNNNGTMQTGITVWADGEGGNIEFFSPNGNRFQMDAYNGNWRMYGVSNGAYCGEITVTPYGQLYGAVWNDYAEYREANITEPGRVVYELGDDTLSLANSRMMPACSIVSDTYGFAIGETDKCKTPLAQAGRVLAYPLEDRNSYKPGDAVCSGPNGTVSKMTQEEKVNYPECIIGYVSCVPDYEVWGQHDTKVNGRIWIKVV